MDRTRAHAMMIAREAKRLALVSIVDVVEGLLDSNVASTWREHPESGAPLRLEETDALKREARAVVAVMKRRAGRLRSVGGIT